MLFAEYLFKVFSYELYIQIWSNCLHISTYNEAGYIRFYINIYYLFVIALAVIRLVVKKVKKH